MTTLQPRTPPSNQDVEITAKDPAGDSQAHVLTNQNMVQQNSAIDVSPYPNIVFNSVTSVPTPPSSTPIPTPLSIPERTAQGSTEEWHLQHHTPISAGLKVQTDIIPSCSVISATDSNVSSARKSNDFGSRPAALQLNRTPSIKQAIANSVGSGSYGSAPNSAFSSPMLNAMTDVTPLPSPLMSTDSPGPWKKLVSKRDSREHIMPGGIDSALVTINGESISAAILNQSKRRAYHGLMTVVDDPNMSEAEKVQAGHERTRSLSEYIPDALQVPKARQHAVSGSFAESAETNADAMKLDSFLRREPNLAVKRGIAPAARPPTPPSSRTGGESSDSDCSMSHSLEQKRLEQKPQHQYFDAYMRGEADRKRRRWRGLKLLGEGTFSRVILATSQLSESDTIDENEISRNQTDGATHKDEVLDRKKLVAIKICEAGPKGGASEQRVEMSLKRELEIMKSIHHPSLVHLKAWSVDETRAILVLNYCPGGDLFDFATQDSELLVPALLRRMFAELVTAVQYLHERHIVHRDIKLENVLVNLPRHELAKNIDWVTYPYSVITLTDLGLSRRVADDEKLTTRCGSDDYAAPEVILGQPYDGRAVDAWSLGVLLYALLESRLPFDPNPGMPDGHKQRSRTSHRIARVEWCWVKFAGDDGDHEGDEKKFEEMGLKGAMDITEGLLKRARSRWTMAQVASQPWAMEAISVEGGIRFSEEDNPDGVNLTSPL